MAKTPSNTKFYAGIVAMLQAARNNVARAVNQTMVLTYFETGKMIVEEEQGGKERADYGKSVIKELSRILTIEFGKGFSERNIEQMRQFYLVYSKPQKLTTELNKKTQTLSAETEITKRQTVSHEFKLNWSHYLIVVRMEDKYERKFYEIEALKNNWSVRELQRQFDSELYNRLALSRDEKKVKQLSKKGLIIEQPADAIIDPYILEFLGLPEQSSYSESALEEQIICKLEHFLLELGTGFTFVGRRVRFTFNDEHFRVDLVFYNRILRCFVLIDLKIGKLKHQDLGQMQMYANYYDRFVKLDDEYNTIGIILCKDKKDNMVEITLPENNKQIFASKYKLVIPTKAELKKVIQ